MDESNTQIANTKEETPAIVAANDVSEPKVAEPSTVVAEVSPEEQDNKNRATLFKRIVDSGLMDPSNVSCFSIGKLGSQELITSGYKLITSGIEIIIADSGDEHFAITESGIKVGKYSNSYIHQFLSVYGGIFHERVTKKSQITAFGNLEVFFKKDTPLIVLSEENPKGMRLIFMLAPIVENE